MMKEQNDCCYQLIMEKKTIRDLLHKEGMKNG